MKTRIISAIIAALIVIPVVYFGGFYFEFYNDIAKNNLPIKYIFNPQNDALECGWFVFDKTLLIPDAIVEYYSDVEKWFCGEYDGGHDVASIPLDEYLQQEIAAINELLESNVCDNAVILVDVNNIENIDIAKQNEKTENYIIW